MRKTDARPQERPAICAALDQAITESDKRARDIAAAIGTDDSAISRYRSGQTIPDRDTVKAIEVALGRPLGYISKLAGYVEDTDDRDLLAMIRSTPDLTESYRRIIYRMVEDAIEVTAQDRARRRKR